VQRQGEGLMRLVHLTDPHLSHLDGVKFSDLRGKRWSGFVSWHKNRRKKHLATVLEKLSGAVRAENADQILLTGDLVQIGLPAEIAQATQWLAALGAAERLMLVPGNHDIYARESADTVYQAWSQYLFQGDYKGDYPGASGVAGQFPVLRKLGKLSLIGLSTACVTPVFMASGKLGQEQLEKLAELLDQAALEKQTVCLLIHHPPLPGMTKWRKALADADALQAVLEVYPPLLIFHGHLHHNREQQWGNTRIYCTASASSASDASYRVLDIEDNGDHLAFQMALKSIAIAEAGEAEFVTVDEQSWQVQKYID
jgi:3',5'-cyclic AMP phosphodiesterase CpdA